MTRPAPSITSVAPTVPESVAAVIARCLRKIPSDRYANADELATALDAALRDAEVAERTAADAAPGGVLSEREALAIWQRAAQLQAEAAHRMERSATLPTATPADAQSAPDTGGYRIRDVEAAAVEAGISRQYVALALAEQRGAHASAKPMVVSERLDRQFTTMLGTKDRAISVSRVIQATPKATLAAIGVVFTADPYRLTFNETVNGHPLDGGVLRFTVPRLLSQMGARSLGSSKKSKLVYRMEQIELFDLHVTLQSRGDGERPQCEVVITGDLRKGLRHNLWMDWGMMGGGAALAAASGTTALAGVIGSVALAAIPGVGLGAVAAGATMVWYRWLYRQALDKALGELADLLAAIDRHLAREKVFSFDERHALPPGR